MKKENLKIWMVLIPVVFLFGCNDLKDTFDTLTGKPKEEVKAPEPVVEKIDSLELAKIILKPEIKEFKITRDPFSPLITKEMVEEARKKKGELGSPVASDEAMNDVFVMGVIKIDDEFRANIKVGNKTAMYKKDAEIRGFLIDSIDVERVVFKSGKKEVIKQRGKK